MAQSEQVQPGASPYQASEALSVTVGSDGQWLSNYDNFSHDPTSSAGTTTETDSISDTQEQVHNLSATDPLENTYSQHDVESNTSDVTARHDDDYHPDPYFTLQMARLNPNITYEYTDYYDFQGQWSGYLYKPKTVRAILTNSETFYKHEIRSWRQYIVVPPGVDHHQFICKYVAREGFTLHGIYSRGLITPAPPDIPQEELDDRNDNLVLMTASNFTRKGYKSAFKEWVKLPDNLTPTPALFDIKLFQPHGRLNEKWASRIWAWMSEFGHQTEKDTRLQLSFFQHILGHHKLVYRGLDKFTYFTSMLARNPQHYSSDSTDFGDGIYYTDKFSVATRYAGKTGVVTIYDWSEEHGPLTFRHLVGEEWRKCVKYSVAHVYPMKQNLEPVDFPEDFWGGAISVCHDCIKQCSDPQPTDEFQIVAKTQAAYDLMAGRLVGVVFMQ